MPWNLKDFTVLFVLGVAILVTGLLVILYFNSNIDSLRIQLQGTGLTTAQRTVLQRSLNSWQLDKTSLVEPFSYIVIVTGSMIMLFSVIYSFLAIYRQKLEVLKQEIGEKAPINEKPIVEVPKVEAVPDSINNLLIADIQQSQPKMKLSEDEKIVVVLDEPYIAPISQQTQTWRDKPFEEYEPRRQYQYEKPSAWWYLAPFLFGIIGGLLGYVATKDDDKDMADSLLIFGALWTLLLGIIYWILIGSLF